MNLDIATKIIRTELESACREFYGEDCKENEESKKVINDAYYQVHTLGQKNVPFYQERIKLLK